MFIGRHFNDVKYRCKQLIPLLCLKLVLLVMVCCHIWNDAWLLYNSDFHTFEKLNQS